MPVTASAPTAQLIGFHARLTAGFGTMGLGITAVRW